MDPSYEGFISGDRWMDETTRLAMPIAIWCAKNGLPIEYGQLDQELVRRHGVKGQRFKQNYGRVAGKIGDLLDELANEWGESIPPVNAIIVSQKTGLPSHGVDWYLKQYLSHTKKGKMNNRNRDAIAQQVMTTVFNYDYWDEVAKYFKLGRLGKVGVLVDDRSKDPIKLPQSGRGGAGGESEEHRSLKEWVADHPGKFIDYGRFNKGTTEHSLLSGDSLDVHFKNSTMRLAVEVKAKNAPDSELARGVFQCVKYQATMRAEQLINSNIPNAKALLVTERTLPKEIKSAAKRLGVKWRVIKR